MSLSIPSAGDDASSEAAGLIDPAQEIELWWGGYAGRTMLPAFVGCALLSAAVVLLAQLLWREENVPGALSFRLAMYFIVLVWAVVLTRWAYLTASVAYRLTNRRLLRERGFSHPALAPIELAHVRAVRVEQRGWERWGRVGQVLVETLDGAVHVLVGVHDPQHVAEAIGHQVRRCQDPTRQPSASQMA